ncbi:TIGR02444 family protein [Xanthobacter sp. KR7-65]|uniref:TIGR02444 family protein n=1 Tax=Xanthobacter sp. KR7-65 TaxID=3156612 RepID=UPI0032B35E3F
MSKDHMGDDAAAALWAFALAVYGHPGVGEACLALQDRRGANVPLLLFVLWLGAERGVWLTTGEIEDLGREVEAWHGEIVGVLRALRRRLKGGPLPAPNPPSDALRETIKAAELAAERIELDALAATRRRWIQTTEPSPDAAAANLAAILATLGGPQPEEAWVAEAGETLRVAVRAR